MDKDVAFGGPKFDRPALDWCADERRVYKHEIRQATGWGDTWLRSQIANGRFPAPMTDPGGKRQFWTARVAREAIAELNRSAVPAGLRRRGTR